jgi:glycosyltransferase involved in cell wall biosynthesis
MSDDLPRARFSLISAVYNAASYLPDYLASIAAQSHGVTDVEAIFVIDGSPDDSEKIIREWAAHAPCRTKVVVQENAGPGAARNAGLAVAEGEWVSFPDPDDILHRDYLRSVRSFLQARGSAVDFLSARVIKFAGGIESAEDTHPLGFKFRRGTRIGSILRDPKLIHLQIASAFLRRSAIPDRSELFDPRVRPVFEDAQAIARFWMRAGVDEIGILADAIYYYRQRSDGSSLIQSAMTSHQRYTDVLRYAHIELLSEAHSSGAVPRWLQYMVLYDLYWPFIADHRGGSPTSGLPASVKDTFLQHVERIFSYLDVETFLEFNIVAAPLQLRVAWTVMKTGRVPDDLEVWMARTDDREQLVQLRYLTEHPNPVESVLADGAERLPIHAKSRAIEYFGRTFLYERIIWVTALEDVRILTGGGSTPRRLRFTEQGEPAYEAPVGRIWRGRSVPATMADSRFISESDVPVVPWTRPFHRGAMAMRWRFLVGRDRVQAAVRSAIARRRARRVASLLKSHRVSQRFQDSWVLIDRDTMARDNAESFYRYLRREQPDVNAWFVIRRSSSDYSRLRREGFRVIAFGSIRHAVLMRRAAHLISSQADHYILRPFDERRFGRGSWKFTFLQHGVTTNDLSRWLNPKPFDLFLAATRPEYCSLVEDETQYVVTTREVALTGFPRHDELHRLAAGHPLAGRNVLLIVPTWRKYLLKAESGVGNARVLSDDFWESDYIREWFGLLNDERLRRFAAEHGLRIVFAPHPDLQRHLGPEHVPPGVEFFSYAERDIKEALAASRMAITDYSSLGTEAVFVGTPLVYFQFDHEVFWAGLHAYRPGYFSFEDHGFGPVAYDRDTALDAIDRMLTDAEYAAPFLDRVDQAYRYRDDLNSERTFRAIQMLDVPWYERDDSLFDGTTAEYDPIESVPAPVAPSADAAERLDDGVLDTRGDLVGA